MSTNQAWIIVADRSNMERCAKQGVFGLNKKGSLDKMKVGDRLIAYIRGEKKIAGLGYVTEPYYLDDQPLFDGDLFPDRVGIKLDLLPPNQSKDIAMFLHDLKFPSNKNFWQASLAGGLRLVPMDDFYTFERGLYQAAK